MKGTITMEIDGSKTKMKVALQDVGMADKCMIVDNLLDALEVEGSERTYLLSLVAVASKMFNDKKEDSNNESGCFRN